MFVDKAKSLTRKSFDEGVDRLLKPGKYIDWERVHRDSVKDIFND